MQTTTLHKDKYYLLKCGIVIAIFAFIILMIHKPMDLISDDQYNLDLGVNFSNVFEYIRDRYYHIGKFLCDGMAFLLYCIPFRVWKVLDTAVYVAILLLIWDMFTDRSIKMLAVTAAGVIMFPIVRYMSSAGYIMTSTNYIYTVLALLLAYVPLIRALHARKASVPHYILSVLGLIYASNQDQSGVISIGGFFLIGAVYLWNWKKEGNGKAKSIFRLALVYFALALAAYIFMFTTPGHLDRMNSTVEMETWLPQFAEWSTGYKFYRGMTSTFANIFYQRPTLFVWFCYLILITVFFENRKRAIIPAILLATVLSCSALDYNMFIRFYDYTVGLPELVSVTENPVPLILAIAIFVLMILSVLSLYKSNRRLCIELMILNILGFGSRFMMGFSATIFASSYRTFTYQLICFLICDVLMVGQVINSFFKLNTNYNLLLPG